MSSSEPPNREIVFVFVSCVRACVRAGGRAGDQGVDVRSDFREKSDLPPPPFPFPFLDREVFPFPWCGFP